MSGHGNIMVIHITVYKQWKYSCPDILNQTPNHQTVDFKLQTSSQPGATAGAACCIPRIYIYIYTCVFNYKIH